MVCISGFSQWRLSGIALERTYKMSLHYFWNACRTNWLDAVLGTMSSRGAADHSFQRWITLQGEMTQSNPQRLTLASFLSSCIKFKVNEWLCNFLTTTNTGRSLLNCQPHSGIDPTLMNWSASRVFICRLSPRTWFEWQWFNLDPIALMVVFRCFLLVLYERQVVTGMSFNGGS